MLDSHAQLFLRTSVGNDLIKFLAESGFSALTNRPSIIAIIVRGLPKKALKDLCLKYSSPQSFV